MQPKCKIKNLKKFDGPNGWRLYAESEEKIYEGDFYPSVTTILDIIKDKGIEETMKSMTKKTFDDMAQKAASIGNVLHEYMQNDMTGKINDAPPAQLKKAIDAWNELKKKHKFHADEVEITTYSEKFMYAGTVDLVGSIDRKYGVGEIKTGKYKIHAGWQACAYKYSLEELYEFIDPLNVFGIHLHRAGRDAKVFKYVHFASCFEAFLDAFNAWRMNYYNELKKMKWTRLNINPVELYFKEKFTDLISEKENNEIE